MIPVEVAVSEGTAAVAPLGEIDIRSAPELRAALLGVLDGGARRVVLDLTGVPFMDSSGLGVLIGAHRRLAKRDGRLEIVGTPQRVADVLRITGLTAVLDVRDVDGVVVGP